MKTLKYLVSAAMVITMHSPLAFAPAMATIVPSSTTTATMESTCMTALGANAGVLLHDG